MYFADSLSKVRFLSELYAKDAPDAVLMTEYPSSNSPETRFRNTEKFIIHDPFPPPPRGLLKTLGPHHLMYGWGRAVPVTSELEPPRALLDHWARIFGQDGCPNWQAIQIADTSEATTPRYITSFPFETLPEQQQIIDPPTLYALHSKEAIAEIPCPQAEVYDDVRYPCILKLSHGYAGLGNFILRTPADLEKAKSQIAAQWPDAPIVINALIPDIIGDYGVQFYLNRLGEMSWLGFTEQKFTALGKWTGGVFNADLQDELSESFMEIARPVASYLHARGYFGVVGIDILQNCAKELFLVDLNPRLTGITPFLMAARQFIKDGYRHGLYAASLALFGNLPTVLARVEAITRARVLILSAYTAPGEDHTKCHVSISAQSLAVCESVLAELSQNSGSFSEP